jgi:enolase-phosphatase E1
MAAIRAVVTDIEGTTTPIAFVRDVLFPYARARLPAFLAAHGGTAEVAPLLEEARRLSGREPLAALLGWMDADAKVAPLKSLQGMIWEEGYASGALQGALYPDVAPNLRRIHAAGLLLYVYSSGSVQAQRLIFGHSVAGDLVPLFTGFFDTAIGGKREVGSYLRLAAEAGLASGEMLFLSDIGEELEAARLAGMATLQLVRQEDGTVPASGFPQAGNFNAVMVGCGG